MSEEEGKQGDLKFYKNQPYDMEVDLNNEEDGEENDVNQNQKKSKKDENLEDQDQEEANYQEVVPPKVKDLPKFDLSKFDDLPASAEAKELLTIMKKFTPIEVQLDTKLKPFIPSYLPSVGEVDAFLKVPRPDNVPEELGLTVVDEPTSKGVDKYILEMELAENTKAKIDRINVKSIQNAEKKPNEITDWINKVDDLQKRKVPTEVNYTKNMPDIQNLMDVWPEKEEQVYKKVEFPNEKMNISLENYTKIACNLMDIPIHPSDAKQPKSLIESLHCLFTLYSGFKDNIHLQNKEDIKTK